MENITSIINHKLALSRPGRPKTSVVVSNTTMAPVPNSTGLLPVPFAPSRIPYPGSANQSHDTFKLVVAILVALGFLMVCIGLGDRILNAFRRFRDALLPYFFWAIDLVWPQPQQQQHLQLQQLPQQPQQPAGVGRVDASTSMHVIIPEHDGVNNNSEDGNNNNGDDNIDDNNNIIIRQRVDNMSSSAVVMVALSVSVTDVVVDDDDSDDENNNDNNNHTVNKRLVMPPASPLALPLPASSLESLFEEQRPHVSDVDDDDDDDDDDIDDDHRGQPDGHDDRPFFEGNVVADDIDDDGGDNDEDDDIENGDVDDDDILVGYDGDDDNSGDYDLSSLFTEDDEFVDALSEME